MDDDPSFGRWLQQRRRALDLTQAALAGCAGCAPDHLRNIEADRRRPSREIAERLAQCLALPLAEHAAFVTFARGQGSNGRPAPRPHPVAPVLPHPDDGPPGETASLARVARGNLPLRREALLGREQDVAIVTALLGRDDVGLLTLTGPGGSGKTRLALEAGAAMGQAFPDGVWFVDLAPISDPSLVVPAIGSALGVVEHGGQPLMAVLQTALRDRHVLLIVDNLEQVVAAAPRLAELLAHTSRLKLLVTSRVVLHVSAEHVYAVPPLAVPEPASPAEQVAQVAAVQLFARRAGQADLRFAITDANIADVAELCRRLDGLPLALELAAARARLLPPATLLARLDRRLQLLTGGRRDLPMRQHTLRATIDWSYRLLAPAEQTVFARLAVFVGGWTLPAAEAVCANAGARAVAVLDGLQALLDASLVRQDSGPDGAPRYMMLETIRDYAWERLAATGELPALRLQHARYFVALAETARPGLHGREVVAWLNRLDSEHPNLRAALAWSQGETDGTTSVRLVAALGGFWVRRSHLSEGRRWIDAALAHGGDATASEQVPTSETAVRATALRYAGRLAVFQRDLERAQPLYEASLALFRALGDRAEVAETLSDLGQLCKDRGDLARAERLFEESLVLARACDDPRRIGNNLYFMGRLAYIQRNPRRAIALLEESQRMLHADGDLWGLGLVLTLLGTIVLDQGVHEEAATLLVEGLTLLRELGSHWQTAEALEGLAAAVAMRAQRTSDPRAGSLWAARLFGAADGLRETAGAPPFPPDRTRNQRSLAVARSQVDDTSFAAAWAEGRAMTLEQAIAEALTAVGDDTAQAATPPDAGLARARQAAHLTAREVDVLRVVAEGATDQDVAARLGLRRRTVTSYLTSIYAKLDVRTRTAAIQVARQQQVI